MVRLGTDEIRSAVQAALREDLGEGDATTSAIMLEEVTAAAAMRAREPLTVAGLDFAVAAFETLSDRVRFPQRLKDGSRVDRGEVLLRIVGPAQALLTAERVALNFVQRLSGVATMTSQFVGRVEGTGAQILDTRKTTPGWRRFEKYAVTCGGGVNHRFGLYDRVLIKDNHLAALRDARPNPIAVAVQRARAGHPTLKVEVEADNLAQVRHAVAAGADFILLDNMGLEDLREAVAIAGIRCQLEASGGVTLATVRAIAETGVGLISVGAITHSVPAVDIGLDFDEAEQPKDTEA